MSVRTDGVYETISGRRYVVVGFAYDFHTNVKKVVFYRQRRKDELFTIPLSKWEKLELKFIGILVEK